MLAKRKVGAEKMSKEFPAKQRYRSKFQRLFNVPFVHGGLTVLGVGTLQISFFGQCQNYDIL